MTEQEHIALLETLLVRVRKNRRVRSQSPDTDLLQELPTFVGPVPSQHDVQPNPPREAASAQAEPLGSQRADVLEAENPTVGAPASHRTLPQGDDEGAATGGGSSWIGFESDDAAALPPPAKLDPEATMVIAMPELVPRAAGVSSASLDSMTTMPTPSTEILGLASDRGNTDSGGVMPSEARGLDEDEPSMDFGDSLGDDAMAAPVVPPAVASQVVVKELEEHLPFGLEALPDFGGDVGAVEYVGDLPSTEESFGAVIAASLSLR